VEEEIARLSAELATLTQANAVGNTITAELFYYLTIPLGRHGKKMFWLQVSRTFWRSPFWYPPFTTLAGSSTGLSLRAST